MWPSERVNYLSRNIPTVRTSCLCGVVEQLPHQLINSWKIGEVSTWRKLADLVLTQAEIEPVLPLVDQPGAKGLPKGVNFLQCLMVINGRLMRLALFKRRAKWPLRKSLVRVILTIVRCSPGDLANGTNMAVTIEGGSRLTRRWSLPLPFFSNRREIHSRSQGSQLCQSPQYWGNVRGATGGTDYSQGRSSKT